MYFLTLINFLRFIARNILGPISEYTENIIEDSNFLKVSSRLQDIFSGFTDFFVSILLLGLFYNYSKKYKKEDSNDSPDTYGNQQTSVRRDLSVNDDSMSNFSGEKMGSSYLLPSFDKTTVPKAKKKVNSKSESYHIEDSDEEENVIEIEAEVQYRTVQHGNQVEQEIVIV